MFPRAASIKNFCCGFYSCASTCTPEPSRVPQGVKPAICRTNGMFVGEQGSTQSHCRWALLGCPSSCRPVLFGLPEGAPTWYDARIYGGYLSDQEVFARAHAPSRCPLKAIQVVQG